LLERYRLFAPGRRATLVHAEVAHSRWVTQSVAVSVSANGFGGAIGLDLSRAPERAHFAKGVWARFGAFQRLEGIGPNQPLQQTGAASRLFEVGSRASGPGC
jgi:Uncharacterized conserved protein (COG2071)